jgi:hypothetical protein
MYHGHHKTGHRHLHVHCDLRLVSVGAYVMRWRRHPRTGVGGFDTALA